ncbi:inositol monophosphatase 3 [Latimeria chalumnae]|uniref:inositol-phosphate phosphatase n=1 Tax=Latimeria chalumnae TaxID=7897 RepID=H2ZXI6_LATCH|nr:PREDICTED: inositol monophosphatase 3 [Latimeria chalumnae]|eukprot:XP_006012858.1 PREDICTED: inositol monophosphatase 3 [Latimeria chalumnae]
MAPMGIRLSPLGIAVFCLLALGVLYHLYSGILAGKLAVWRLGDVGQPGPAATRRSEVDLRELLALSVEAAVRGGQEVRRIREGNSLDEKSKGETKEGAKEMLTTGDLLSHRKMFNLIKNTFPNIKVNSEEHDDAGIQDTASWDGVIPQEIESKISVTRVVPTESITVWIDPLDATQEYTEDLRQYVTTMVCVAVDGKPVIGVIHKPFSSYTAWGIVDGGSNVKARTSYSEKSPRIIVSRSHAGKVKSVAQQAFGNNTVIIQAGGAGYKVLSLLDTPDVKQEQADVYIHVTFIKKWDICAGNALLSALGGHMTTLKGEEIDYSGSPGNEGGLLASIMMNHDALVEKLPNIE